MIIPAEDLTVAVDKDVEKEISQQLVQKLNESSDIGDAPKSTTRCVKEYMMAIQEDRLTLENVAKSARALMQKIQERFLLDSKETGEALYQDFAKKTQNLPMSMGLIMKKHKGAPLKEVGDRFMGYVNDYEKRVNKDIDILDKYLGRCTKYLEVVRSCWDSLDTNLTDFDCVDDKLYAPFTEALPTWLRKLRLNKMLDVTSTNWLDPKPGKGGYGSRKSVPVGDVPLDYAGAAKDNAAPAKSKEPKRWVDYSSDSDDDLKDFSSMLESFSKTGIEAKPKIKLPKGFDTEFPHLYKGIKRRCEAWKWDVEETDNPFVSEGFIGPGFGRSNTKQREEILDKLTDLERVALNTFVSFIASVLYTTDTIASGEKASLVSGYVTSLFLKKRYKDSEKNSRLLRISLKAGDAGESIIRARIASCFQTGSTAADSLTQSVSKMLNKIVSESDDQEMEDVLRHSQYCFTSSHGMMHNTFRTVQRRTYETQDTRNKRGKRTSTRVLTTKAGKDRPNLSVKELELTQSEKSSLRKKEKSFNRLDDVVRVLLEHPCAKADSDPLATARVVKCVVDAAYSKISDIRQINKRRRESIRSQAQEIVGDSGKITSSVWEEARKKAQPNFEEIGLDIYQKLSFDKDEMIELLELEQD